jgi:succinate dehydrogenase / fumarate reductase, membrane anchor subunit
MTTTTQSQPVTVRKTLDQVAWTWMRYSAFLLIPLAWGHLILQDVVIGVHNMSADYAIQRITSLGWKTYDVLLLAFAFAHGMNGVRQVLRDYIHNQTAYQVVSYLLLFIWFVITLVGAIALFAINKPIGG